LRCLVLAIPVAWIACGSSKNDADRDALRACYDYAAAMQRCLSGSGADRQAVSRQVDAITRAIDTHAADPAARAELKKTCESAVAHLERSCPAPPPDKQASL
jgi:hypothetical protein